MTETNVVELAKSAGATPEAAGLKTDKERKDGIFDSIKLDFASVSGILTVSAAVMSMVFIFGYLEQFDVSLIMMIEYTDVLKFMLIGSCVIFALFMGFNYIAYSIMDFHEGRWSRKVIIVGLVIYMTGQLFSIYWSWHKGDGDTAFQVYRASYIILGAAVLYLFLKTIIDWGWTFTRIISILFLFSLFLYLVGNTYGLFVRDHGQTHDLAIREDQGKSRVISGARLVLFTSHHVIVKVGPSIITLLTADVQEISSSPH
jgi:hypothetical protein